MGRSANLKIVVLGCSTGAELYSALWIIRKAQPDLRVSAVGIDISETCIKKSIAGVYQIGTGEVAGITDNTYEQLFTRQGDDLRVQDWLREGVAWKVISACSATLRSEFGLQDVVMANNFLCHMPDPCAEDCLRNIAKLVVPGGYLFVWGIDLDLRTRVVRDLGLTPVTSKIEEIYAADQRAIEVWPLKYWGIEPLDKRRPDWTLRYATIFELPGDKNLAA
jgi:SAM-dependent methyltransferase